LVNLNVTKISLSIPKELLKIIDEKRGLVTRSAYIVDLIEKQLRIEKEVGALRSAY